MAGYSFIPRSHSGLVCLNLNWIKSYDILLVFLFYFLKCINSGLICHFEFWHPRRKPALMFSKWLFFQNSFVISKKKLLVKSLENDFIFVPAFYLIKSMCLMKAPKNFEKRAILKIFELVSLWGLKLTSAIKIYLDGSVLRLRIKPRPSFGCFSTLKLI